MKGPSLSAYGKTTCSPHQSGHFLQGFPIKCYTFLAFSVGIIRLIFGMTPLPRSAYLLGVEGGDAGQHLALEELERGAAARGAEGHLWLELG